MKLASFAKKEDVNRRLVPCGHVVCSKCMALEMKDLMRCPICDTCVTSSRIIPFELLSQDSSALSSEFLEQLLSATKTNENRAINKIVVSFVGNFPKNIFLSKKKLKVDLEQMMNGYDVKGQLGAFFLE